MHHGNTGDLLATTEQMLLHVDTKAGKASVIRADVYEALRAVMEVHREMDRPGEGGEADESKKTQQLDLISVFKKKQHQKVYRYYFVMKKWYLEIQYRQSKAAS